MTPIGARTQTSSQKPWSLLGMLTAGCSTLFFTMFSAACFLSVVEGWRSYHQHDVSSSLKRFDALLAVSSGISPPAWIKRVENFYENIHAAALKKEPVYFSYVKNFSTGADGFFQFQERASSRKQNLFSKQWIQMCSAIDRKIIPLLSGVLAVILNRFWMFITALPLFLLSLLIGGVDGLVQRDIRKFQGARENALLFHTIRSRGTALFLLPLWAYFAWLSPVSPEYFLIPMAITMAIWLAFSVRFFKKYV